MIGIGYVVMKVFEEVGERGGWRELGWWGWGRGVFCVGDGG